MSMHVINIATWTRGGGGDTFTKICIHALHPQVDVYTGPAFQAGRVNEDYSGLFSRSRVFDGEFPDNRIDGRYVYYELFILFGGGKRIRICTYDD